MGHEQPSGSRRKASVRKEPKSTDPYRRLLFQSYSYLADRTESPFCGVVKHRLCLSKSNRPAVSVSVLSRQMEGKLDHTAVVVGTITADDRVHKLPAMKVCALRFTREARAMIVKNGGSCITFDQLAMENPRGSKTVLIQGKRTCREVYKHFGKPSGKHSSAKPKYANKRDNKGRGYLHKGW